MDSQLFELLRNYLEQIPSLLAVIGALVFAITRLKLYPRVALVVVIALAFILLLQVINTIVYSVVPTWFLRSRVGDADYRTIVNRLFLALALITNGTLAIGFAVLVAAIFMRRTVKPISET
jgi:hypothetical protein